ncbi:carboxypeptidase-like regulatory domain-containing protein [Catellatospora citrea]|uniref:MSCRAMM family protein n=1 Tax=Catellatospora citrea TaxID=53366 RepID=UPI0033FA1C17
MTRTAVRAAVAVAFGLASVLPASAAYAEDPAPGAVTGHVVTQTPGNVTVNLFTTGGASAGQVFSDGTGAFTFAAVPPGTYKIQYGYQGRFQWSHEKLGFSTADVVTVASGQTTAVPEESMLLPGIVDVVATDKLTGAPVDAVCAGKWEYNLTCGALNGVLRLTDLGEGTHDLFVRSADGLHASTKLTAVKVVLGQVTRIEVALEPTSAITTKVVDRATGAPVADVCLVALQLNFGALDDRTCEWGVNRTDADGNVTVGELKPGEYTLLVVPNDDVHGIQWLGRRGGVGRQHDALRIQAVAGALSTATEVKLDPKAAITGTVRDAATGEPLGWNGCAQILPTRQGSWPTGIGMFCGDGENGTYTIPNLGPYDWPLQFSYFYDYSEPYERVWTGGATDRKTATTVRAGVDQPGVADASLRKFGTRITLQPSTEDGQPFNGWLEVEVYNARTGDLIRQVSFYGPRVVEGLADQNVRLRYFVMSPLASGWYGGTDFASAKTVKLVDGAAKTVKLVIPYAS